MFFRKVMSAALCAAALSMSAAILSAGEIAFKDGMKVSFLGDSITAQGAGPFGYVTLVAKGLETNGIKIQALGAGIGGHKSNQMLERLEKDVISKKPDMMTLSCGVNDVWHGVRGVSLEDYKKNITSIVDKAQAANIKVVILTSTMIKEDANNDENKKLAAYNEFLKYLAAEKKCILADLNTDMQNALKEMPGTGNKLTTDGVHMNPYGNMMMATGVLKACGLTDEQIAKAKDAWEKMPGAFNTKINLSIEKYNELKKKADAEKLSVDAYVEKICMKALFPESAK